ncbi:TetR/AcrR family transcriptional regulator [Actinomadura fibrosa]|uniref:TetR/AcrR family transcriptional regulator n=1 Tax=Actinomadura fibrosa TaxID=111802 RepID=A0ABW2XU16_9ACTN|nr:TetR/AcrR family transcriptional regulator [Actinomadura fibrosa]
MPDVKHFDPDAVLEDVVRLFWRQGAAATGVQDVVDATGLSRSSLYATFGGKRELYRAALRRYVEQRSGPAFQRLAEDRRGLPAIADFFAGLVRARCSGEFARWGCMVSNAHAAGENADPQVRAVLDEHHERLRDAMLAALTAADAHGQLAPGVDAHATAELLALLAYGVNLRSRAGADAGALTRTVDAALALLSGDSRATLL